MKTVLKFALLAMCLSALSGQAQEKTSFNVLHSFGPATNGLAGLRINSDGLNIHSALTASDTVLYGTATEGGTNGTGVIFKINPDGSGFTLLHQFSAPHPEGLSLGTLGFDEQGTIFQTAPLAGTNVDGAYPVAGLILSGNTLYGTATGGGNWANGTVFKLNTDGSGFTVLHSFTNSLNGLSNPDGFYPAGGLVLSGTTLYGTTYGGGPLAYGTVYQVSTNGSGFQVLHAFNYGSGDGIKPASGLLLAPNGLLFGTTRYGGTNNGGALFALDPVSQTEFVIYSLEQRSDANHLNLDAGSNPLADLILSGDTLFGTTQTGGSFKGGTVFSVATNGDAFISQQNFTPDLNHPDAAGPTCRLLWDNSVLYGTAVGGGINDVGVVFRMNPDSTGFAVLHAFTGGADGSGPWAGLVSSGNTLYGATEGGGTNHSGVLFSLSSPPAAKTNLVFNGDFELSAFDFPAPGWNTNGDFGFCAITTDTNYVHTGTQGAVLGTIGGDFISLSQNLETDAGANYALSFWLKSDSSAYNEIQAQWNGAIVVDLTNLPPVGWTNITLAVNAPGTNTLLQFNFRNEFGSFGLDDITVSPPSTATPVLTITRASENVILTWSANATGYTLQSTTNLATPHWITTTPSPVAVSGQNTVTDPIAGAQMFYRLTR